MHFLGHRSTHAEQPQQWVFESILIIYYFYVGGLVEEFDYGGWGEGEVDVGYEAVAEADTETAVA